MLNIRPGEGAARDRKSKCGLGSPSEAGAVCFVSRDPPMLGEECMVGLDFGAMDMVLNRYYLSNSRNVSLLIRWNDNRTRDFNTMMACQIWGGIRLGRFIT